MAQINNSDVIKELIDTAKINTSTDKVPNQLAEKVVPVLVSNPERKGDFILTATKNNTGSTTFRTVSASKSTYLTSGYLSYQKDATNDTLDITIRVKRNNETVQILKLNCITSTADSKVLSVVFPQPIKLDKGSNIEGYQTLGAGSCVLSIGLFGYEVED